MFVLEKKHAKGTVLYHRAKTRIRDRIGLKKKKVWVIIVSEGTIIAKCLGTLG